MRVIFMKLASSAFCCALACMSVFAVPALAQDEQLYESAPPPGAAFVRVINLTEGDRPVEVMIGGVLAGSIDRLDASPYRVVEEREMSVAVGEFEGVSSIEPGRFFSIVARGSDNDMMLTTLEDIPNTDRTKAQLVLYNLTGETDVDLVASGGSLVVFEDVAPDSADYRNVNALTVDFSVMVNGTAVASFADVHLERGAVYGFVVGGTEKPDAALVRAETRS